MAVMQNDLLLLLRVVSTSFVGLLLVATLAAPLLAAISQLLAKTRSRIFYDKFAKQVAQMGLLLGLCTLPFTGSMWALFYTQHPVASIPDFSHPLLSLPALLPIVLYVLGLFLLSVYASNWKRWKGKRIFQSLFGWLAWISLACAAASLMLLKRTMQTYPQAFAVDPSIESYLSAIQTIPLNSAVWPLLGVTLLGGIGAAAVLGGAYCLSRRDKEDFGRDYYAFALKAAAWWGAAGCTLGSLATGGYAYMMMLPLQEGPDHPIIQAGFVAAGLQLLAALLMLFLAPSATPLRRKFLFPSSCLFLTLAAVGVGIMLYSFYTLF